MASYGKNSQSQNKGYSGHRNLHSQTSDSESWENDHSGKSCWYGQLEEWGSQDNDDFYSLDDPDEEVETFITRRGVLLCR